MSGSGRTVRADAAIVGGGAIGLALAWELTRRGRSAILLDAGEPGRESSWAGAGILPPCLAPSSRDPLASLHRLSMDLHPGWAERLAEETQIDVGFRRCGGIYLAFDAGEAAALAGMAFEAQEEDVPCEELSADELTQREPALAATAARADFRACRYFPGEWQIRNPRFVRALLEGCRRRGVVVRSNDRIAGFELAGDAISGLRTERGEIVVADAYVVAAGAWSARLLASVGVELGLFPMRGQMLLYEAPDLRLESVVNVGSRYLVPRDDGMLLAGSTEEETGFQKGNTDEGLGELRRFAEETLPPLARREPVRWWSGLRPATFDGLPYLGRVPGFANLFVAAGHFRSGLTLAPGSAVATADLLCGETPAVDLNPFRVGR